MLHMYSDDKKKKNTIEFTITDELYYKPLSLEVPRLEIFSASELDPATNMIRITGLLIFQSNMERKVLDVKQIYPFCFEADPSALIAKAAFAMMDRVKEYPSISASPIYFFTNNPTVFKLTRNFFSITNGLKKSSMLKASYYVTGAAIKIAETFTNKELAKYLISLISLSVDIQGDIDCINMMDAKLKYPEGKCATKTNKYGEVTKLLA